MPENEYQDCYIAFLDLLGFKNLIQERSCEEILRIYETFDNPMNDYLESVNSEGKKSIEAIRMKVMSDSICFYVPKDIPHALFVLIICCCRFQSRLLYFDSPILIRGAITSGKIYANGDTTFGPGLTEAYLMEEKNAKYPRIIVRRSTLKDGLKNEIGISSVAKVVMKKILLLDFDSFYTINYMKFQNQESPVQILEKLVREKLSSETDSSIREKYLYLKKRHNIDLGDIRDA